MVSAATIAHAIENNGEVELLPAWEDGAKSAYEIIQRRQNLLDGKPMLDISSRTDLTVEFFKAGDGGYYLNWKTGKTVFDDPTLSEVPDVRRLGELVQQFTIQLELDDHCNIERIKNWKALQSRLFEIIEDIAQSMRNRGCSDEQINVVINEYRQAYATEGQINAFRAREPQIFLQALGKSYSLSTKNESSGFLPNPFGGEPFPTVCAYSLRNSPDERQTYDVVCTQSFEPEATERILKAMITQLGTEEERRNDEQALAPLKNFLIEDRAEYKVDASTRAVLSMKYVRRSRAGRLSRVDILAIKPRKAAKQQ